MMTLIACLIAWLATEARADTVYLRNGNELKGLVLSSKSRRVILDIGYGTVEVDKSQIARIKRDGFRPPRPQKPAAPAGAIAKREAPARPRPAEAPLPMALPPFPDGSSRHRAGGR